MENECSTCGNLGFIRQKSRNFPVIKCPFCREKSTTKAPDEKGVSLPDQDTSLAPIKS